MNANYIARGLSGICTDTVAVTAGRIMLRRLHELATAGESFAYESTLSRRSFAPFLSRLTANGYRVAIYYFSLSSVRLALQRVKLRVSLGGHDVPADVVKRRFARSRTNFLQLYAHLADEWALFDNSRAGKAQLIAEYTDNVLTVKKDTPW